MKYLVLDFETYDPYINEGLGAGWPFYKEGRLKVLCFSYLSSLDMKPKVSESLELLTDLVSAHSAIVCHNSSYDVGLLHALDLRYEDKLLIDTLLLAKLDDNNLLDYSLDGLSLRFFNERKTSEELGAVAQDLKLVKSKAQDPVNVAMRHLDKVYEAAPELVQRYAAQDVYLTNKIYRKLADTLDTDGLLFYSDLIKAFIKARSRGVRVDRKRAQEVGEILQAKMSILSNNISELAAGINVNSSKQLSEFFDAAGIDYPRTEKGNPSINKEWLTTCSHPLAVSIVDYKKYEKAFRDFIEPVLVSKRDRTYPEVKIFGAAATGRMSCANPNLQQIPKRDKEIGPLVRSIYLPEEGEQWCSLDFSSQEPRIQIHFAHSLNAPGVEDIVQSYHHNVRHDLHSQVAEMAGIDRPQAKTINLGLAYGMGLEKLATSLNLPMGTAKGLLERYHKTVPFMKYLTSVCRLAISRRGYIKTLGGRKLLNDNAPHKAMNKLVQGSAADQTYAALVQMYREDIPFMFPVHDSIEISTNSLDVVSKVKKIMTNCMPLIVPSHVEVEMGSTWGSLTGVEI